MNVNMILNVVDLTAVVNVETVVASAIQALVERLAIHASIIPMLGIAPSYAVANSIVLGTGDAMQLPNPVFAMKDGQVKIALYLGARVTATAAVLNVASV